MRPCSSRRWLILRRYPDELRHYEKRQVRRCDLGRERSERYRQLRPRPLQRYREQKLGLPWENKEGWGRISPWGNVEKITTPTLVMGGKEHWNVSILNSGQIYPALRRRGIERPSFRWDRWERCLDWYERTVRGR